MLLHDIGKSLDATFSKINHHLETNYGFKISENASDKDLVAIMEQIDEEITDLKVKGEDARTSPEISKRLLVLEGIKTLREYAVVQFQSNELEPLIAEMIDKVVNHFNKGGVSEADFHAALKDAMRDYRKSEYDFPNDYIQDRVCNGAMTHIKSGGTSRSAVGMPAEIDMTGDMMEATSIYTTMGKREGARGGHASELPDTEVGRRARDISDKSQLSMMPKEIPDDNPPEPVPMVRDRRGNLVPDPFAAQAAARRRGIAMTEHTNLVKNLRRLLETEVSQAEVMMAAKGFSQDLQEMVEKIGRLQNEDLPPVADQMRETYGMASASAFRTQIYSALQGVMDSLYTAKQQVDDAVSNMALNGQVDAQTDMDIPVDGMDDGDMGSDDGMGGEEDLDNIGDEVAGNAPGEEDGDEFGAEEDLGRSKKMESTLQRKVMEMKKLVAKAKKLKEARN